VPTEFSVSTAWKPFLVSVAALEEQLSSVAFHPRYTTPINSERWGTNWPCTGRRANPRAGKLRESAIGFTLRPFSVFTLTPSLALQGPELAENTSVLFPTRMSNG